MRVLSATALTMLCHCNSMAGNEEEMGREEEVRGRARGEGSGGQARLVLRTGEDRGPRATRESRDRRIEGPDRSRIRQDPKGDVVGGGWG